MMVSPFAFLDTTMARSLATVLRGAGFFAVSLPLAFAAFAGAFPVVFGAVAFFAIALLVKMNKWRP